MQRLLALLAVLGLFGSVLGQQQSPDDCLMKCTNEHYQKSPNTDAMKMLNVQPIKIGNITAMCPQVGKNQTEQMDVACASLKELRKCTDACPDTPIKKLTLSAFRSQQFVCVDRLDDIKKNMPCLSEICPDVQRDCTAKCGSIEGNSQKIVDLIHRVQGGAGRPPASGPPGATVPPAATEPPKDVDMGSITSIIADTCKTITCFMTCGEGQVTKQCGKEAYLLQRDFTWTMFSSVAQSMSSIGIQQQWPEECKALANSVDASSVTGAVAIGTGTTAAPAETGGTGTSAVTTPKPSEDKTGNTNGTDAKCAKPPCSASITIVPSITLLVIAFLLVFRDM